ncbi:hypothetical protein ACFHW2_07265 [Actinomadura sp. LOL_016]|uniref:hypothetical protein n=1 Tax=unclassified Actinomadura TaxID=2626254 RepID=UPI003A7F942B
MVFERLVDDAALDSPGTPVAGALRAYRTLAGRPPTGRLRCPVARFGELRRHLVPEDLLDLAVVADAGTDELPDVLDGVRGEPRVRPVSVHVALPPEADQARAAAVAIARLPRDVPVFVGVRHRPGRRAALDRIAAARVRGAPFGVEFRAEDAAEFVPACMERDLPFTCTSEHSSSVLLLRVLHLAAGDEPPTSDPRGPRSPVRAQAESRPGGGPRADEPGSGPSAHDRDLASRPPGVGPPARDRTGGAASADGTVRRVFVGFAVPDVAGLLRELDDLGPVRTRGNGEHLSP